MKCDLEPSHVLSSVRLYISLVASVCRQPCRVKAVTHEYRRLEGAGAVDSGEGRLAPGSCFFSSTGSVKKQESRRQRSKGSSADWLSRSARWRSSREREERRRRREQEEARSQ